MDNKNIWLYLTGALIAGILIGGGVVYFVSGGLGGNGNLSLYPPKSSPDWLAKIDDYVITKADFEAGYQQVLSQIPEEKRPFIRPDMKKQYFESLLKEYILCIKALNDGVQKVPENQIVLKSYIRQLLSNMYLQKNAPADKSVFMPSKMEVDAYFAQNKADLDKSGMKSDQLKQYIVQVLGRQKEQAWIESVVSTVKETIKVERNNSGLLQEGVTADSPQAPQLFPQPQQPALQGSTNK
jgi:hypothetical protein